MRIKKFVSGLFACIVFAGILLISCANHSKAKGENVGTEIEDFESFLEKFTSSAAFQYTRIKFPMKTPITLMTDDGNSEKTFPFTKDKWPLLDSETLKEERITQEEGGIYVSKFTLNEPGHKVFEAGYKETPLFEKSRVQIVQNITIIIQNIPSCIIQNSTSHQGCISLKALLSS